MLTIRRHSVRVTDKERDDLFVHLFLDTEPFDYLSSWDRFFKGEVSIKTPWAGNVSKDRNEFKVRRTRTGIFKNGVSILEIYGKLRREKDEKIIEIKIRPVWYAILNLTLMISFLCIVTLNYFNDFFGWTIVSATIALQLLFLTLDLNKTKERFVDYLDHTRSNAL